MARSRRRPASAAPASAAGRATDTVPRERASAHLKARTLAARLAALAERMIRELEESTSVDPDKLADALELLKMAKLAARPRKRRTKGHEAAAADGPPFSTPIPAPCSRACVPPTSGSNARRRRRWRTFRAFTGNPSRQPSRNGGFCVLPTVHSATSVRPHNEESHLQR